MEKISASAARIVKLEQLWTSLATAPAPAATLGLGTAILSMLYGNIVAIAQRNIKRLLAYSAISHIGFLFLGFAGGGAQGYVASCAV